jgi:hypothetical protein
MHPSCGGALFTLCQVTRRSRVILGVIPQNSMGRGFTQYSYPDGDLPDEYSLYSAFLDYVLDDGARIHVNQADYYCEACDHIVVGELIESVTDLEHQIDQIQNHPESDDRKIAEFAGDIPKQIAELQTRITWRKTRKSAPKCLYCGSINLAPIPDEEEFEHPATGQRMKVSGRGFTDAPPWHATYTSEGDLIKSGAM